MRAEFEVILAYTVDTLHAKGIRDGLLRKHDLKVTN